ncbi:MAG: hypothetical protein KatS3mg110_4052 [Pirellulaceae bacterium]|nr:MAG: hypothetical protein KatS3mg110_4052 [Pirellulaceae bacterium]
MFAKEWLNAGRRQEGTPAGASPDNRRPACIRLVVGLVPLFLCESAGCRSWPPVSAPQPPAGEILVRGQLTFYADFPLPRRHRLIDELVALRADITEKLLLPASDEPIQVYLFKDADQFRRFLWRRYPQLPDRRAFFVETDTRLAVFAHWGDRVAEDLRHELAHGYLHAVVPNLPLWLDEGLAEYFEVPRGHHGLHTAHVQLLWERHQKFFWKPALERLERFDRADQMGPLDFAEAWLVVHWLLETTELRQQLLQNYLARLRLAGESPRLVELLRQSEPDYEGQLLVHLVTLYPQIDPP